DIGTVGFIHFNAEAHASSGCYSIKQILADIRQRVTCCSTIDKGNATQQTILGYPETKLCFAIKHVCPPKPALYISPARSVIGIPGNGWQFQVGHMTGYDVCSPKPKRNKVSRDILIYINIGTVFII